MIFMCFKKMIICCGQHLVGKKTYFSGYPLFNLYISPMWSCRGNNSLFSLCSLFSKDVLTCVNECVLLQTDIC